MANSKTYSVILGMKYDAEIIGKLDSVENKSAYIKDLISRDISGGLNRNEGHPEDLWNMAKEYSRSIEEKYKEQFENNAEKTVAFQCSRKNCAEMIEKLDSVENKSEYVKHLILADMGLIDADGNRAVLRDVDDEWNGKKTRKKNRSLDARMKKEMDENLTEGARAELEEKRKTAHREAQKRYREKVGSKAQIKWNKENLKRIPLDVSLDFFEIINNHVFITGEPRNTFIKRAIIETIERDKNNS